MSAYPKRSLPPHFRRICLARMSFPILPISSTKNWRLCGSTNRKCKTHRNPEVWKTFGLWPGLEERAAGSTMPKLLCWLEKDFNGEAAMKKIVLIGGGGDRKSVV